MTGSDIGCHPVETDRYFVCMKFQSTVERVVGNVTQKDKKAIAREMEKRFLTQYATHETGEAPKSPEQLRILELADEMTNEVLRHYGKDRFSFPPENVHVIEKDRWTRGENSGVANSRIQSVSLRSDDNALVFFTTAFHEMLHLKSYYAVQVPTEKGERPLEDYRLGLHVRSRDAKKGYFQNLDEAVTEELTKRFASGAFSHQLFKKERDQFARYRPHGEPENDEAYAVRREKDADQPPGFPEQGKTKYSMWFAEFAFQEERESLWMLCEKMHHADPQEFPDASVAFDLFAKGMLNGNILPLGRAIDRLFGKGTFRRIGEAGSDTDELRRIVTTL